MLIYKRTIILIVRCFLYTLFYSENCVGGYVVFG